MIQQSIKERERNTSADGAFVVRRCVDNREKVMYGERIESDMRSELLSKVFDKVGYGQPVTIELTCTSRDVPEFYNTHTTEYTIRANIKAVRQLDIEYIYQPPTLLEDVREMWTTPWQRIRGRVAKFFKRK